MIEVGVPSLLYKVIDEGTKSYTYCGVPCLKDPFLLAIMTLLLSEVRPSTIVEVGSYAGGSAMWMRDQMRVHGVQCMVYSVDVSSPDLVVSGIVFVRGDARRMDEAMPFGIMNNIERPLLVVEDSDHHPESTYGVLEFFDRWSQPGEYVVVEDGDAEKYAPGLYGGGPIVAIKEFLARRGADYDVDRRLSDMYGGVFHPDAFMRRVR